MSSDAARKSAPREAKGFVMLRGAKASGRRFSGVFQQGDIGIQAGRKQSGNISMAKIGGR